MFGFGRRIDDVFVVIICWTAVNFNPVDKKKKASSNKTGISPGQLKRSFLIKKTAPIFRSCFFIGEPVISEFLSNIQV